MLKNITTIGGIIGLIIGFLIVKLNLKYKNYI